MQRRRGGWSLGLAAVLAGGLSSVAAAGQRPPAAPPAPSMRAAMRAKLTDAQGLLGAVVTRDFAAIDQAAERLSRITEREIGTWQARPAPPEYAQQAVAFLTAVQRLREAARDKDIQRAGEAYASLTASCVTCHRFGRDTGTAPR